jgi:subtilisin family serine protease
MKIHAAGLVLLFVMAGPLSGQTPPKYEAWVQLSDKGISSAEEGAQALLALEATFDPRALQRRRARRTLPGLFDERDLPLHQPYLDGIHSTGAELRVRSRWLNGVGILATREQLSEVEALPFVQGVTDIHPARSGEEPAGRIPYDPDLLRGGPEGERDPYGWSATQIRQLNLPPLHEAGFRGRGIRIGVIDTGFLTSHPAFQNPSHPLDIVAQWDFVDNDTVAFPEPGDDPTYHEHGSLILGALAANLPGELMGSAPEAEYILLKAEDSGPEYFLEERWFVAALEFAEANGADIISSSVVLYEGYDREDVDGFTSVMAQGWNLATGNGVIGLQGGGNSGYDDDPTTHHLLPPAGAPDVITVGAATSAGEVARFSSDGIALEGTVKPELLALGQGTASISPYEAGAYTTSAGTSMATPVLAGAVACLLQAHPGWSVAQIREALFHSGDFFRKRGGPDPLFIQGFGIPDLARAAGLKPTG